MSTMAYQNQHSQFQFPTPSTGNGYTTSTPQTTYSLYTSQSRGNSPPSTASSSTTTPQNSSPTSPHTMHATAQRSRQGRPQKAPMYVPAVLRPTQPPRRLTGRAKAKEVTPPGSVSGSSLEEGDGFESERLRRSSTTDSSASSKWGLGRVSSIREGAGVGPSREHWKPDAHSTLCDAPSCRKPFTLTTRRHHCRRCGNIFCDAHSAFLVPLDANVSFSPDGARSRACDHCFGEFVRWERERVGGRERASALGGEEGGRGNGSGGRALVVGGGNGNGGKGGEEGVDGDGEGEGKRRRMGRMESIAASIPRDWNWSTF